MPGSTASDRAGLLTGARCALTSMIAAQYLALLPFWQADGKPPGGVQDRERAEDDKEDRFVHARITSSSGPSSVNAIKRRGGPKPRPDGDTQVFKNSCARRPSVALRAHPMHAGLGAVSVCSMTRGWPVFGRLRLVQRPVYAAEEVCVLKGLDQIAESPGPQRRRSRVLKDKTGERAGKAARPVRSVRAIAV
jgi:hypothetical protein